MTGQAYRAKKILLEYRKLDKEIGAQQEMIQHWFDLATRATPSLEAERVSGTGDKSKLESAMIRRIDLQTKNDEKLDELERMRDEIGAALDQLDDRNERTLLLYRYITGKSWPYIMTKMEISERTSFRLHESALIHFAEIYF